MAQGSTKGIPIDTDVTLSDNSDLLVPSQKAVKTYADTKQTALVSGTNIKTINGNSLLGSGNISISGATLADGDYGDVTVSSSGTVITIDNLAVTDAKINDVAWSKVTGEPTTLSGYGISDTKANFDTACSDGNFLFVGDVTQYTDELAQDAVGAMVDTSLVYTDATPLLQRAALTGAITASAGSNTTALGSFTKAQLDGAVSDGNVMYVGDQPSLSSASAFATGTTTVNTATYLDVTGCSVTLGAGTWIIFAHIVGAAVNTIIQCYGAITDGSNNVIAESAASRPGSGTASLSSPISMNFQALVTPVGSTTYKLRAARGLTTHTATWTVYDGSGYNTVNHATNNSDKGTSIIAIRIA